MKPRIIPIIIGIIIAVGVVVYAVVAINGGSGNAIVGGAQNTGAGVSNNTSTTPAMSIAEAYPAAPASTTFPLGTPDGTVMINNFYAASGTQLGDDGVLVIKQTSDYWLTYDPSDSSFWIAISGSPFGAVRQTAEADFLATLGIKEVDACKLQVSESAPYASGSSASGQSYPLSFCANAQ